VQSVGHRGGDCGTICALVTEDVMKQVQEAGVKLVRFLYCDYGGIIRTKVVHHSIVERKLHEGVNITFGQAALNVRDELVDIPEMPPVDEVRLVPDPASFTILPWVESSASVVTNLISRDRNPWFACTRSFLRRQIEAAAAVGMTIEATTENEFFLYRLSEDGEDVQPERFPVYSSIGFDAYHPVMLDIADALTAQGVQVELAMNEYGAGQQEVSIRHQPALAAADTQIKVRDTVRGIALRHGYRASFAPKPWLSQIGSGAHIHMSLWNEDRNLLYDAAAEGGLSDVGRWWVGGLVHHLPALLALTCPSMNSYQRLQPSAWAGDYLVWGFDNREAPVRVASPYWDREEGSYNVELKACDSSSNPHLALGATIAAGLDGVARKLDPGDPVQIDPVKLPEGAAAQLPHSLAEVLDLLEADEALSAAMGPEMAKTYVQFKRSEVESYKKMDPEQIAAEHRYKF
jgi:glutamine synthetase